jgi:signal transduction histidine kinase
LLARRVRGIADELQHITRGLHPARLQHLGLVPSLRALAREMEHGQVRIDVAEFEWPNNLPGDVALSLYRVAQEAIHNAIKHSASRSILVSLRREHDELSLVVSDNGVGFTPRFSGSLAGLGIPSMRHRLRNIGGSLSIVSAPGQGTTVNASLSRRARQLHQQPKPVHNHGDYVSQSGELAHAVDNSQHQLRDAGEDIPQRKSHRQHRHEWE